MKKRNLHEKYDVNGRNKKNKRKQNSILSGGAAGQRSASHVGVGNSLQVASI